MRAGVAPEAINAWLSAGEEPEHFEVWSENWLILEVFLALSTQWRWSSGMESRRVGLDYSAIPVVCDGLQVKRKRRSEVFEGLRVMEHAALEVMCR